MIRDMYMHPLIILRSHSSPTHSRIWRAHSMLLGADCSWGILDEVVRALNLGPMDLEDSRGPDAEAPLHVRCVAWLRRCVCSCGCRSIHH